MAKVKVYGSSDDRIELEGDLYDEFYPSDEEPFYLAFSDGTVLSVVYGGDGVWTVRKKVAGTAKYTHTPTEGSDSDEYSDVVELEGNIKWCVAGPNFIKKR